MPGRIRHHRSGGQRLEDALRRHLRQHVAIRRAPLGGVAAMALRAARLEDRHHLQDLGEDEATERGAERRPREPRTIARASCVFYLDGVLVDIHEDAVAVFDVAEQ